jgi:hypothetical protein
MEIQAGNVRKFRSRFQRLCEIPFNPRTKHQVFVHAIKENNAHLVTLKVSLRTKSTALKPEPALPVPEQI